MADAVTPKLPPFLTEVPAALDVMQPPASDEEIRKARAVRDPFRLPISGNGYVIDYIRAFRAAEGISAYLEVGSRDKGNLAYLAPVLARNALIVDVDLEHIPEATARLEPLIGSRQRYVQIEGNSVSDRVLSEVAEVLKKRQFDMIFLDSSHVYGHFLDEFGKYWDLLKPGGIMLVHDIFWEGNDKVKGKAQVAELLDRHVPVYAIFRQTPLARFHRRPTNTAVWGGFGVIVKPEA